MRCGPHLMLPAPAGTPVRAKYEHWIRTVRPPVMKMCRQAFDPVLMDWTRQQGTRIVGRWVEGQISNPGGVLAELLPFADHLDGAEFANEESQGKDDPRDWARLMGKCQAFMEALDAANLAAGRYGPKAVIANVSVGQPELARWDMPETIEVARYAAAHGHYWGAHEYYKPRPWAMIEGDRPAWDGQAPARGWLMLRCEQVAERMRANGVQGFRFVVTESGRDNVPGQPGDGGGWRDEPVTTDGDFADFMRQYGRHLSAMPECIGWVDYGANAWSGWEQFDLFRDDAMLDRFIAGQLTLPPRTGDTMIEGCDVSHHQGRIDWTRMAARGMRFAWIKASEGTNWADPAFAANAIGAAAAGLLWGPYHFWRAAYSADEQAAWFARCVGSLEPSLPVALDFEDTKTGVDPAALKRFVESVEAKLGRPVLYTGAWWWRPLRFGGSAQPWAGKYPLWVADYDGAVALPSDWADWTVHQYTSSAPGAEYGAQSGALDLNRYRGTFDQLAALRIPPATTPRPANFAKVVWAEEQVQRILEAEGLTAESAFVGTNYTADAIRRRG